MRDLVVEVLQDATSVRLLEGTNSAIFREGVALLSVAGSNASVALNDAPIELQSTGSDVRVGALDFSNRPGLHRISVISPAGKRDFDFATATAKATWLEVEAMVKATRLYTLGIGKPFLYLGADGTQVADSLEDIVLWLNDRLSELATLAKLIDRAPAARMQPVLRTSARGRGIDLRATASLLRERPSLLEESADGGLLIADKRYWPSLVRTRSPNASIPQQEHRQLRTLLVQLLKVCRGVAPVLPDANAFVGELQKLLALRSLSANLAGAGDANPMGIGSSIERRDPRYGRLRELESEYRLKFSHLADPFVRIRAGIRDVWEIYQAFVAHAVGRSLGLDYFSRRGDLRERDPAGASMLGNGMRLFYDAQAPAQYLPSWRSRTARPALERPDIVVIDEANRRALVLDVKFSVDSSGRCRSTHLFEMQGYLNSYAIRSGGILFPGRPSTARNLSNGDFTIGEIPLTAEALLARPDAQFIDLRSQLDCLWHDLA